MLCYFVCLLFPLHTEEGMGNFSQKPYSLMSSKADLKNKNKQENRIKSNRFNKVLYLKILMIKRFKTVTAQDIKGRRYDFFFLKQTIQSLN